MYAKQLALMGKNKLIHILDITGTVGHQLKPKATFITNSLKKINPQLASFISRAQGITLQEHITYIYDGFKAIDLNYNSTSKNIRTVLDNREHGTNQVIEPKIIPTLDKPKLIVSLSHLKKLTSVKHKNTMLRILNGDIFCKLRLHRFKMIDSNLCDRCGEIETSEHLLINCPHANRIWSHVQSILASVNINFNVTIENVLNVGNHTNDQAIIAIVAEINAINMQINRPTDVQRAQIVQTIKNLIKNEKSHALRTKSLRKYNKVWKKIENIE
jgi:uncharacterized protein (UPF0335 family)